VSPTTAKQVRAARKRLGLSLRGLGEALEVSHNTIRNWEEGIAEPPGYLWRALRDLEREMNEKQ
jgi:DNA-binding transcriptional regulator YiaG